jgi:hypothetical protein
MVLGLGMLECVLSGLRVQPVQHYTPGGGAIGNPDRKLRLGDSWGIGPEVYLNHPEA